MLACVPVDHPHYTTRPLTSDTWDDFATLVEANNGVWGGCWCMGFHPEAVGPGHTRDGNRRAKQRHVTNGTVHQTLVYAGDECVGWCQYGSPAELPNIKNPAAYRKEQKALPDWRIGCLFTGSLHRGTGVARAAVAGTLEAIRAAGAAGIDPDTLPVMLQVNGNVTTTPLDERGPLIGSPEQVADDLEQARKLGVEHVYWNSEDDPLTQLSLLAQVRQG